MRAANEQVYRASCGGRPLRPLLHAATPPRPATSTQSAADRELRSARRRLSKLPFTPLYNRAIFASDQRIRNQCENCHTCFVQIVISDIKFKCIVVKQAWSQPVWLHAGTRLSLATRRAF
ncbi:unnamed protein product [Pieris brassicae]|uniref:Uncharacterized protein n=1 Tax=Pieris brassicae TaxID=7116 RepID=A0A9P0XHH8_PIEBR|nr:unnamed protein product [Pieris brassicae]